MKILLLLVCSLIFLPGSFSQNKPWSFRQCVDSALKNNISINQSRLTNELNKVNLAQSKSNRIPTLSANVNEGVNFGKSIDPLTNAYVIQTFNSTNFSLSSGINIFNGLQNSRTIELNSMTIEAGKYDVANLENTITLNITMAYLQVLFAYEILAAAENQEASTAAQVERTQKLVNAGKVPESNLLQIKSQYATDKLSTVNAQGQLDMAKVTLLQLMEMPVLDSFEIEKPVAMEPSPQLLKSNQDIYRTALTVQPQITGAAIRSNNALLSVRISEGSRWPRLNLTGNVNTNFAASTREQQGSGVNPYKTPFFEQLWNNLGESVGLTLSMPIYNNRQIRSNIDRARINAMTAKLSEQNTRSQLRKTIEQTYTDLKNSMKKYEATKEQYTSSEVSYKNTETKFNVGVVTAIDFLIEKNNYFQAQSNLIQSKYDYIFKSKILDFYEGKEIVF
jgi:outer membrane protein